MVNQVAGSRVLLLGSGFGESFCLYALCTIQMLITHYYITVTKPTVDILDQAGVEVTVGK